MGNPSQSYGTERHLPYILDHTRHSTQVNAPSLSLHQAGRYDIPTPKGWTAELTLVLLRWFTCRRTLTHPRSNHLIGIRLAVEPATSWWQVRRRNRCVTKPAIHPWHLDLLMLVECSYLVLTVGASVCVDGDAADVEQVRPVLMYVRSGLSGRHARPVRLLLRRVHTTQVWRRQRNWPGRHAHLPTCTGNVSQAISRSQSDHWQKWPVV